MCNHGSWSKETLTSQLMLALNMYGERPLWEKTQWVICAQYKSNCVPTLH